MNTIKLAINGPISDPDLGTICTVDAFRVGDGWTCAPDGIAKSWYVKTDDVVAALRSASEKIEDITSH